METLRLPYVYDAQSVSDDNSLTTPEESLTRQEFKDESDINTIIRLFGIGENPIEAGKWITDVDIVNATSDFQTAMNILVDASNQFNNLPASLRGRFENDPAKFVAFVSDSSNFDEMLRLGLATERVAPPPSDTDRIIDALKASGTGSS